jgi:hypothetical protein
MFLQILYKYETGIAISSSCIQTKNQKKKREKKLVHLHIFPSTVGCLSVHKSTSVLNEVVLPKELMKTNNMK